MMKQVKYSAPLLLSALLSQMNPAYAASGNIELFAANASTTLDTKIFSALPAHFGFFVRERASATYDLAVTSFTEALFFRRMSPRRA